MAKIYCPNKDYTGVSASVSFVDGKGETDNKHLIKWFKEHGYKVEDGKPKTDEGGEGGIDKMTVKELKAYAKENGIDLGDANTKAEIIAAIEAAEADVDEDETEDEPPEDEGENEDGEEETE